MNKLLSIMLASVFVCVSSMAVAAPEGAPPPAHQQKNQVPESTGNGNYLEAQPDNSSGNAQQQNQGSGNAQQAKPGGAKEKSKRFQQSPEDGGTGVKTK